MGYRVVDGTRNMTLEQETNMSEATQGYLELESESRQTNPGFQSVLNYIRERATSEYRKGELFERLMLTYFSEDPDYKQQFSEVYLYKDWAEFQTGYDANDIGIDLVAKEHDGGFCAIQCKCCAENTRISKPHLDSFISASASELFTSRLIVDTGGEWGPNALRTIDPIKDKLRIIRYSDLENSRLTGPIWAYRIPYDSPINRDASISRTIKKRRLMTLSAGSRNPTAAN